MAQVVFDADATKNVGLRCVDSLLLFLNLKQVKKLDGVRSFTGFEKPETPSKSQELHIKFTTLLVRALTYSF